MANPHKLNVDGLILGYLAIHGYSETCEALCQSKPHLKEEYELLKATGAERPFESNLSEILEEYGELNEMANEKLQEIFKSQPHISNFLVEQRPLAARIQFICEFMHKSQNNRAGPVGPIADTDSGNSIESVCDTLLEYVASADDDSNKENEPNEECD